MKPELYIIECKSNLHVGSGDSNYGVIDKLIQRDTTDQLPCIYSSSLKGAFCEYFEEVIEKDKEKGKKELSDLIFGGGDNKKSSKLSKGSHIFHQAFLLSIPLRSNRRTHYNSIAPMMAGQLLEMSKLFTYELPDNLKKELEFVKALQPKDGKPIVFENKKDLEIEDFVEEDFVVVDAIVTPLPKLKEIIGDEVIILSDSDMKRLTNDYHLPIIARNKLENGKSQNLWYEQVLPRKSVFTAFVVNGSKDQTKDDFKANVEGKTVQIGGDSSVGYGYCHVYSLPKTVQP
ncbi:MAG: type III-B CRISPR module RAMP protein Cmr4 [Prolixibacteraceae bacterium]|jgi:CRISPR-associated protein Cmr4|nr:type III-B CRISPR module RAMP protein Cmr4 [Prolixibacteraceae bacterium]